ncbi:MAG: histidine triad nucleotide-binding protein [Dehalococcoidia bacterium]
MSCIFCQIVNKEVPSDLIYEDDELIAFRDIQPQAPVHFLVLPRKHIPSLAEMKDEDFHIVGDMARVAVELARKEGVADAFRTVMNCGEDGGQTVWHVHMHVLGGRKLKDLLG